MPYLNITEVESAVQAAAGPPNTAFTQLITLPNLTWEGRQCHAIKIAGASGPGRIGVYFLGGVHSREWGSPDILINFIEQLTKAYHTSKGLSFGATTFTAAQIQAIVNTLDIFVFPQANPDGRNYSMTTDAMWRKNRRLLAPNTVACPGVDVNRNYDFLWDYPVYFNPAAAVVNSTNICSEVYIGPGAFSEPESTNAAWMTDTYPNIRFFIDLHSYGEDILYSWGDDDDQTTDPNMNFMNAAYNGTRGIGGDVAYREYIPSCDQSAAIALANALRAGIQGFRGRSYLVEPSFNLYATAGTSDDYCYSRHFVDKVKGKVISYTIEWGSAANPTPFHPAYSEMSNIIQEVTGGLLQFCLWVVNNQADTYIRDNTDDTGVVPYGGVFWDNSDVFVRQSDDNVLAYEPAKLGQTNYIYANVINLGPAASSDVKVTARAVRFPGTEFLYPYDWTTIDADHVAPTPIIDTFAGLASGASAVAKFSLSAAQVATLWGWQTGGWHPCLLADVEGCGDYGSAAGPHVWENNNLAQRNISIVAVLRRALVQFPFLAGHILNRSHLLELVIDRKDLPEQVELWLDPFDPARYFPGAVSKDPGGFIGGAGGPAGRVTFTDRARVQVETAGLRGSLDLAPGSSFEWPEQEEKSILSVQGGLLARHLGRTMVAIREPEGKIVLLRQPGTRQQLVLRFRVPASARLGDIYRVRVGQRNEAGRLVGGVTLETVVTE